MRKAVAILPTFNEAGYIKPLIKSIEDVNKSLEAWEIEILIVDSFSTDDTSTIVKELQKKYGNLHIIEVPKEGLGRAYLQGFNYAINKFNPYLIIQMDADGQHDPKKIPDFLNEIQKGADFVVGTRYSKGGSIPKNWGIHRKILSIGANLFIRLGFMKLQISEWTNGYRAIKTWIVKGALNHIKNYSGYVFQVAMLDYALRNNAKTSEIPVDFKERRYGISKINAYQYILQIFLYVLSYSSFIKFVIVGLIGFVLDFGISFLGINILHKPVWLITLLSTETAIISNFFLNNFWSFDHKRITGPLSAFIIGLTKFNLISSVSIAIQTGGIQLMANFFGSERWYIYKILIIAFVIIPYSYILYNKVIWKNK